MLRKTTNEYFLYLFAPWDYPHTEFARNGQIHLQFMYATGPKRHYSTRLFRSTGPNFRPNWLAMAGIYQPTLDRTSRCREAQRCAGTAVTKEFDELLKCGRLQPTCRHGQGARNRLSRHCHASDPQSRLHHGTDWRCHADPVFWGRPEFEIFTTIYYCWMVFTSTVPTNPGCGFAGARHQRIMNSPILSTFRMTDQAPCINIRRR